MSSPRIRFEVRQGDALDFVADVLALKHAQALYGVDLAVYERFSEAGYLVDPLPALGASKLIPARGLFGAGSVLFIGVEPLRFFGYQSMREFGREVLASLAATEPPVRHVALTIHGPGYGLDEEEAFESEMAGIFDAIASEQIPVQLSRISFVERNHGRAVRLRELLENLVPGGVVRREARQATKDLGESSKTTLRTAGVASDEKPHVFVAMPFADSMEDVFHFGIQGPVRNLGFLCERADLSSYVGDVMEWVKRRISSAALVVADLSMANPNVYLEVGYAWGIGRPTILLIRDDPQELKFDVRGQRCLVYKGIKNLEETLTKELSALFPSSG
jgi:hypothetical protein